MWISSIIVARKPTVSFGKETSPILFKKSSMVDGLVLLMSFDVAAMFVDGAVIVIVEEDCDDEDNVRLSRFTVSFIKICLISNSIERLSASSKTR